jgi:chromosome segregation ATPase
MADNLGVVLQLLLDKSAQGEVEKGFKDAAAAVDELRKSSEELTREERNLKSALASQEKALAAATERTKQFRDTQEQLAKINSTQVEKYKQLVAKQEEEEKALAASVKSYKEQIEQVKKAQKEQAELAKYLGVTVSQLDELTDAQYADARAAKDRAEQIKQAEDQIRGEYQKTMRSVNDMRRVASSIQRGSQTLTIAGTAITASLFAFANKEAQRLKEAGGVVDETTKKWLDAQKRIELSYQRVGRTALETMLPTLEKIAAIAEKASKFVEKNPQIVQAALNIGTVMAAVGVIGTITARGIQLTADIVGLVAKLKEAAGLAALSKGTGAGVSPAAAARTLGTVTLFATSLVLGAKVGELIGNAIARQIYGANYQKQGTGDALQTAFRAASLPGQAIALQLKNAGLLSDEAAAKIANLVKGMDDWIGSTFDAEEAVNKLTEGLDDMDAAAREAAESEGLKILRDLERENLEAERQYAEQRAAIINASNAAIINANNQLIQAQNRIRASLKETLSRLSAQFAESNIKAEQDFQARRAEIIRDGEEAILKLREQAQERLRELEERFGVQEKELTAQRDALGLAKARDEFARQQKEIERNRDREIAERRRDTQQRLADLRASFEQERAERLQQYQQDVAEAKAQAQAQLKEAQIAHAQQVEEIRRQKALELNELQRAYTEERRRRIMNAYDQIKELGEAQNAERIMRQRYYQVILADADAFMNAYARSIKPRGGSFPTRRSGGYSAGEGLHYLHANEFVMSPEATKAATALIGGRLTQGNLLASLSGGKRVSITWNDQRRFDSSLSDADRNMIRNDTLELVDEMVARIGA